MGVTFLICLSSNRKYVFGKGRGEPRKKIDDLWRKIQHRLHYLMLLDFKVWENASPNPFFAPPNRDYEMLARYSRISGEVDRWWQNDQFLIHKGQILWALMEFKGGTHTSKTIRWYRNYTEIAKVLGNVIHEIVMEWHQTTRIEDKDEVVQAVQDSCDDILGIPSSQNTCALLFSLLETLYYVISLPRQ